jgi:hypothetical protein
LARGRALGRLIDVLLEAVIGDPRLNERDRLVALARTLTTHGVFDGDPDGDPARPDPAAPDERPGPAETSRGPSS